MEGRKHLGLCWSHEQWGRRSGKAVFPCIGIDKASVSGVDRNSTRDLGKQTVPDLRRVIEAEHKRVDGEGCLESKDQAEEL